MHLSFTRFADDLADELSADGPMDGERSVLTEEERIGCTLGMLQCLDRPHRLAYILGEILGFSGPEAADVFDVTSSVFRKRLERTRDARSVRKLRRPISLANRVQPVGRAFGH